MTNKDLQSGPALPFSDNIAARAARDTVAVQQLPQEDYSALAPAAPVNVVTETVNDIPPKVSSKPVVQSAATTVVTTPSDIKLSQGENKMADVDTTQLSQEHGSIRHDIAVESARLGQQIGAEACGIRAGQGDIRREQANGFADTRYNIAERTGDVRREVAAGFGDTRFNIAERTGDIRREVAQEAHGLSTQIGKGFCDTDSKILATSGDIRREVARSTDELNDAVRVEGGRTREQNADQHGEIIKEGLKGDFNTVSAIKDSRFELASRVEANADRLERDIASVDAKFSDRFFTVGRDLMDIRQGQVTLAKDVELNALKTQLDAKQNTQYLNDRIVSDGEKTRALINDLKYHDLNRGLVERNTALVNCEQDRRHYHDRYHDARFDQIQAGFQGQWAQLQSQIQAFQSQLQETRQGMVNFGTMAGVGQSSTSNNVR